MKLNDYAVKYGTDKQIDKHGYVKYYEQWLEHKRNDKIKLLEIGVQEGRSHLMWKDYMPNAMIYGIDIDNRCSTIKQDRVYIEIGDSSDKLFSNNFCFKNGPFNVIIDDGGHYSKAQIKTFEIFFPHVVSGGLYVIEDLHTSYWREFTSKNEKSCISYLRELVDEMYYSENIRDAVMELAEKGNSKAIKILPLDYKYFRDFIIKLAINGNEIAIEKLYYYYDDMKQIIIELAKQGNKTAISKLPV